MTTDAAIRICIIEDHLIVRAGLRMLLEAQPDMDIVGEAATREESLRIAAQSHPNMFLVDLNLNGQIAVSFLKEQGFKHAKSVKGGISAWSDEIDHNVPKY